MDTMRRPLVMRFCLKTVQKGDPIFAFSQRANCRPKGRNKTGFCVRSAATTISSSVVPTVSTVLQGSFDVERLGILVRSGTKRGRFAQNDRNGLHFSPPPSRWIMLRQQSLSQLRDVPPAWPRDSRNLPSRYICFVIPPAPSATAAYHQLRKCDALVAGVGGAATTARRLAKGGTYGQTDGRSRYVLFFCSFSNVDQFTHCSCYALQQTISLVIHCRIPT